jgi:uncharacterized protein YodC (DUF2158 family)
LARNPAVGLLVQESEMEFKAGDLVKLKSGGPVMTVVEVDEDEVLCVWFPSDDHRKLREADFDIVTIEKVEGPAP